MVFQIYDIGYTFFVNTIFELGIIEVYMIKNILRWPGIEPGSTAWKAAMLTTIPPTLYIGC